MRADEIMQHVDLGERSQPSRPAEPAGPNYSLPISKLRGVPFRARALLKVRRITTCAQLLGAAASHDGRARLARDTGVDMSTLDMMVERADMARVNGIGAVFGMMLEDLGIRDVGALADQDRVELHGRLRAYNTEERIARRSPTAEEVEDWVGQARALQPLLPPAVAQPSARTSLMA